MTELDRARAANPNTWMYDSREKLLVCAVAGAGGEDDSVAGAAGGKLFET